jgi:prepilin-type N-terminal cleavage/methylation domain-containing protein
MPILSTNKAFTLVEVLVTVLVIGMLALVGGGLYVGSWHKRLLEKNAKELLLAAKYARITAIEQQTPCHLRLDRQKGRFWLAQRVAGSEEDAMIKNPYARPRQLADGVLFENIRIQSRSEDVPDSGGEGDTIVFSPDGTADQAAIALGDGRSRFVIRVSPDNAKTVLQTDPQKQAENPVIDLDVL